MKVHIEKDGVVFDYETTPMPKERFEAVCGLIAAVIVTAGVLGFFALFTAAV